MPEAQASCSFSLLWSWDSGKTGSLWDMMIHKSAHMQPCETKDLHISGISPCLLFMEDFPSLFPYSWQHCPGSPTREVRKVFGLWHPPAWTVMMGCLMCPLTILFNSSHTDYIDPDTQWGLFSFKNQHQVPSICIISLLTTKKASSKALQQSLDNGWEA